MSVNKQIFIIGCPRSGTTMLLDILATHKEFAWISQYIHKFPNVIYLCYLQKIYDNSLFGLNLYQKKTKFKNFLPIPIESWTFFNFYLKNFQWERFGDTIPRVRTKEDITIKEVNDFNTLINKICKIQNKKIFLTKYTDFPRITYLKTIFPDAKFIHIHRDGRAVANSYYKKMIIGDFNTWNEKDWWIKGWPNEWREEFLAKFCNPLGLAAFQWKFFIDQIWKDSKTCTNDEYYEISYEDIIKDPNKTINDILEFCEVNKSNRINSYIEQLKISNMNEKWGKRLNINQQMELRKIIKEARFIRLLNQD